MSVKAGIVVNRMFVGDYLSSNLGHEIINLFQADNGCHYLYLNASGSFAAEHTDIGYMLMVKNGPKDCFEVIGMAKGLMPVPGVEEPRKRDIRDHSPQINEKQKSFIKQQPGGDVKYGGISILDIFNKAEQQNVFITFKASEVYLTKDNVRIYLHYSKAAQNLFENGQVYVAVKEHNQPKTSLKSYIYPSLNSASGNGPNDYDNILTNIIFNDSLWNKQSVGKVDLSHALIKREVSLFDICRIQDDENRISNAISYFMSQPEYRHLWLDFFKNIGIFLEDNYGVEREVSAKIEDERIDGRIFPSGGRIDLLIRDSKNIVVIENKIKSDINTIDKDAEGITQLNRYVNYIEWVINNSPKDKDLKAHFLVLAPNYNIPKLEGAMEEKYRVITYKDLYDYLNREESRKQVESDSNFKALKNVLLRHSETSPNGYLFNEMLEKFTSRIKESGTDEDYKEKMESSSSHDMAPPCLEVSFSEENINKENNKPNKTHKKMAIKSAISGEYIITQEDNGSIRVCQIFDNVIASLKEAAKSVGFKIESNWKTTQGIGKKMVDALGDGYTAEAGEYTIVRRDNGHIDTYRVHGNTIAILRKIASEVGLETNPKWNTRTLGSNLIDFISGDYQPGTETEEVTFEIRPDMTILELFDNFKEMFGGHLRIKDGTKRCDPHWNHQSTAVWVPVVEGTLADIGCKAKGNFSVDTTVGEFQDQVKKDCGISVIVATPDNFVTVLPEFTLDAVNLLPNGLTKAKMQEILER